MENTDKSFDNWIPNIEPYELPGDELLSANKVDWRIHPDTTALLIHDFQEYWLNRFAESADLRRNVRRIVELCRKSGMPVIYTAAVPARHPAERGLARDLWGPGIGRGCSAKAGDIDVDSSVKPRDDDYVLKKPKYSSFYRTELEEILRATNRDQLILTGVYGHHGILATALDAYMRNIKAFFVVDAIGDYSLKDHLMGAEYVAETCGTLTTTEKVCEQVADFPRPANTNTVRSRAV